MESTMEIPAKIEKTRQKKHVSCEIEVLVETRICSLCVILRTGRDASISRITGCVRNFYTVAGLPNLTRFV